MAYIADVLWTKARIIDCFESMNVWAFSNGIYIFIRVYRLARKSSLSRIIESILAHEYKHFQTKLIRRLFNAAIYAALALLTLILSLSLF